jgi:hypothetical protein
VVLLARHCVALAAAGLACASVPRDPAAERCDPDASFERGLADGRAGRAPAPGVLADCDPTAEAAARSAYGEGHRAGAAARAADARPPSEPGAAGERDYRCEVQARGDTFPAHGPTPADAEAAVRAACKTRNPERLCEEAACRRNE